MTAPASTYFVGLDLGPTGQFTALAVLERTQREPATRIRKAQHAYALRHLQRFPPGTSYGTIIDAVRSLLQRPVLKRCVLVVDQTGVGRVVKQQLYNGLHGHVRALLFPITLTNGIKVKRGGSAGYLVPKLELITTLQVLLQSGRLLVSAALADSGLFVRELENFRLTPKLADDNDEASWREGQHDDLVFAGALAAWVGEMT